MASAPDDELRVVCVGAGPRTLGVLDRLAGLLAVDPDLGQGRRVRVDVLDPYPPGAGRVWRREQSPLLWMNSRAADVAVLPDESSTLRGSRGAAPTLYDWVAANRERLATGLRAAGTPGAAAEVEGLTPGSFPSRTLAGAYLVEQFDGVLTRLRELAGPDAVRLHRGRAVDLVDAPDGRQLVRTEAGPTLTADVVLLAQGHLEVVASGREHELARIAAAHDLDYVAPAYTNDADLSPLAAGQDVLVLGMGLAFVDLVTLVTEGRGGRFSPADDSGSGRLVYHPSGDEPVLHVGTRRGVPYRSKLTYEADVRAGLRWYSGGRVERLRAELGRPLDLRGDVWPLIARDLAFAHYRELFAAHPGRTRGGWAAFAEAFERTPWGSAELAALVAAAVPAPEDRLDLARFDRPLDGDAPADPDRVHGRVVEHIGADLLRRGDPRHSADQAVFVTLLHAYAVTAGLVHRGVLSARSAALDVDGWWHGFFSYAASGPPPARLTRLLALAEAGLVRFLGAGTTVGLDEEHGCWVAGTDGGPAPVRARVLVDARLPAADVTATTDPLLAALHRRGEAVAQQFPEDGATGAVHRSGRLAVDPEHRLHHADGSVHPRRFAVGPAVAGDGWAAAFARPRLDHGFFRLNERVAADLLAAATRRFEEVATPALASAPR
ncbi:FAD/NAD(P)-binding protein [Kineococcus gynurae]|uniref:FAD/NAD(P)-binding protein n=2 Tax=Kineococcus gynurae TaxID=452979 RepID=A0ABV5LW13_9ACTN